MVVRYVQSTRADPKQVYPQSSPLAAQHNAKGNNKLCDDDVTEKEGGILQGGSLSSCQRYSIKPVLPVKRCPGGHQISDLIGVETLDVVEKPTKMLDRVAGEPGGKLQSAGGVELRCHSLLPSRSKQSPPHHGRRPWHFPRLRQNAHPCRQGFRWPSTSRDIDLKRPTARLKSRPTPPYPPSSLLS